MPAPAPCGLDGRPTRRGRTLLPEAAHDEGDVFASLERRVGLTCPETGQKVANRVSRQRDGPVQRALIRHRTRLHTLDHSGTTRAGRAHRLASIPSMRCHRAYARRTYASRSAGVG